MATHAVVLVYQYDSAYCDTCPNVNIWHWIHTECITIVAHEWCNDVTQWPRQNSNHFPDDIFKCIFFNENIWISIRISLKLVPNSPVNNIPSWTIIHCFWVRSWNNGVRSMSFYILMGSENGLVLARRQAIVWTNDSYQLTPICVTRPHWVEIKYLYH